ncbi:MAG: glycosyltransferase [Candidatus Gastranaerophilales bacterium]|nr:glycosyltransferase [Candidatus Gastranaerophilales bacterium]
MLKISVIVPIYNAEPYLSRCLESILNQTLSDIEIICVNDGSDDNSAKILEEYSKKDERIFVITQENGGMSAARNTGVDCAKGEFIGFVDADDFIEKDFYLKLYNAAKSNSAEVSCGCIVRENDKKQKKLVEYKKGQIFEGIKEKFNAAKVPQYCFIWNKIYLRETLIRENIRFIDGIYYEDMAYTPEVMIKINRLVVVPNVYYHYCKHPNSAIKKDTDKVRADKLSVQKKLVELCDEYGLALSEKNALQCKQDYKILGIKILKIYKYRATKKYYLFGLIPFLTVREYV